MSRWKKKQPSLQLTVQKERISKYTPAADEMKTFTPGECL
jgi:hypothetical protein